MQCSILSHLDSRDQPAEAFLDLPPTIHNPQSTMETSINLEHQDLSVVVRLQVWHYNERGRCTQYNNELARLFAPEALGDWNNWTAYPS